MSIRGILKNLGKAGGRGGALNRQIKRECRASIRLTAHFNLTVMRPNNPLGDAQTQSRAAGFSRSGLVDSIESFEDLILFLLRDTNPGISDFDNGCSIHSPQRQMNGSLRSVLNRIVNQNGEELLQACVVSEYSDLL